MARRVHRKSSRSRRTAARRNNNNTARKTRRHRSHRNASALRASQGSSINRAAAFKTYRQLQNAVDKAWARLRSDVRGHANAQTINKDKNRLLILLGECNYMARECARIHNRQR